MREGLKLGGAAVAAIVVAFVLILALAFMAVFSVGFFSDHASDRQGQTSQNRQTKGSGSYRIASYDKFFDQCAAIQGQEATIEVQKRALEQEPNPGAQAQIRGFIAAADAERGRMIAQYNADASKHDTRGNFLSSSLPYFIDSNVRPTRCAL